ncbi:hypothetical protein [Evansella tamaricis]|uniref:Uncharacterized protein n=1 Tax=Evansella tamaricis TaxID=2069301 RepID=A0ABS6JHT3_9BACI|nr:hypothetical protein [Evansella tamaricis]MBU9713230.1 hypothetical protein [Evansella tamaricis]
MQIFATFEHSMYLEVGISELQKNGITDIFAVPLKKVNIEATVIDSLTQSDGRSFLDSGFALAVVLSTIFASKGFQWQLGAIYWGLIGAGSGILIGLIFEIISFKMKNKDKKIRLMKKNNQNNGEIILIINCQQKDVTLVYDILKKNLAIGVAKVSSEKYDL